MARNSQKPVRTTHPNAFGERYEHPAFGCITLTHYQGSAGPLFGSEIDHMGGISLIVREATLERRHNGDGHFSGPRVLEVNMSALQFAELITSFGNGNGTPCTIVARPPGGPELMPRIDPLQTQGELMKSSVREAGQRAMDGLNHCAEELEALLDAGSISKTKLREIMKRMRATIDNTPSNMQFAVTTAEESIERAQAAAKADIRFYAEQHIGQHKRVTGADTLTYLADREDKGNPQ